MSYLYLGTYYADNGVDNGIGLGTDTTFLAFLQIVWIIDYGVFMKHYRGLGLLKIFRRYYKTGPRSRHVNKNDEHLYIIK